MFDLSWSHIAILLVVALLVLGPKELPNAIRTGASLLRLVRQHRQRRLQAMRKIAGLCHCARHAPFTLVKQRVQLIDHRLHLCRISAADTRVNAFVHGREAVAQLIDWRQAPPDLEKTDVHQQPRNYGRCRRPLLKRPLAAFMPQVQEDHGGDHEVADRPEGRAGMG